MVDVFLISFSLLLLPLSTVLWWIEGVWVMTGWRGGDTRLNADAMRGWVRTGEGHLKELFSYEQLPLLTNVNPQSRLL